MRINNIQDVKLYNSQKHVKRTNLPHTVNSSVSTVQNVPINNPPLDNLGSHSTADSLSKSVSFSKKSNFKKVLYPLLTIVGIGILAYTGKNLYNKKLTPMQPIKKLTKEMQKFPRDIEYRKEILKAMGLPESDFTKLRSLLGEDEFKHVIDKLNLTPESYCPGIKSYKSTGAVLFKQKENVKNHIFSVNLHVHTRFSDGKFDIEELLNQAASYGDELMKEKNQPFVFSITDHDCVQGVKEAIKLIYKNPEKYKNIRFVTGIENTTMFNDPTLLNNPVQIHVLSYAFNPFSKNIENTLIKGQNTQVEQLKKALAYATEQYNTQPIKQNINFDIDEFIHIFPFAQHSLRPLNYTLKDYIQFKTIYQSMIKENSALAKFLKSNNIQMPNIDLMAPVQNIGNNLDYSQGQKYWQYYAKALKNTFIEHIKKSNPNIDEQELSNCLSRTSLLSENFANFVEAKALDSSSKMYIKNFEFPNISDFMKKFTTEKYGVCSLAHPGVFFPLDSLKDESQVPELFDKIYKVYKQTGGDKAYFAENNYQSYFPHFLSGLGKKLTQMAESLGLKKTGGLDSHIKSLFDER